MRFWVGFLLVSSLGHALVSGAQLAVQVQCEKESYLVYEPIPVAVSIHNYSGRTLQLENTGEKSWLEFLVTDESGGLVRAVSRLVIDEPLSVPPGQTVARTEDILPLYELRVRGTYRIQAVVNAPGVAQASTPVQITVTNGREIWSQMVGLPVVDGCVEEYRTYALIARRGEREDSLYVSVRDEAKQIVYSLVALGGFLATVEPQALVDGAGNLHVVFQNGPRSFGYAAVNPIAKVLSRAAYSDFQSRPTLVSENGEVTVRGGEQTYPKLERVLSEDELNPPPPPAVKAIPKRHWWWPFGPKS